MKNANAILTFICNFHFVDTLFFKNVFIQKPAPNLFYAVVRIVQIIFAAFKSM